MDLPPNASLEEIEGEKLFNKVLLDTLDVDAEDFLSRKQELEETLEHLDRRQAEHPSFRHEDTPATPNGRKTGYMVSGSRSSTSTLPSRSLPDWRPQQSPSHRNGPAPGQRLSGTQHPTTVNKRPRELSNVLGPSDPNGRHKARRTSESTSTSRSSNADSFDSLDDTNLLSGPTVANKLNSANDHYRRKQELKKMEQRQRDAEERYKRIRDDEAFARSLSQTDAAPSSTFASSSRPQNHQSTFGHDARIARPQPPTISQPQTRPSGSNLRAAAALQRIKTEADDNLSARHGIASQPGTSIRRPVSNSIPYNDDTDLQVITPQQFREQSLTYSGRGGASTSGPYGHAPTINDNITPVSNPGSFPQTSINGFSMPPVPGAFPNPAMHSPGPASAVDHDPFQVIFQMHNNRQAGTSRRPLPASHAGPSASHGLAGSSVFGYGLPSPAHDEDEDDDESDEDLLPGIGGQFSTQQQDQMRNYGLGHYLEDSSKTTEEIQTLLDNIRPDEELLPDQKVEPPPGLNCTLMPHQQLGYSWLKLQEEGSNKGSILADDMGLGKTIQAIALMLGRRSPNQARKTTLIVAPVALMRQWKNEIENRISRSQGLRLTVQVHHGAGIHSAKATYDSLAGKDVVLTTYGTLAAEWKRKSAFDLRKLADPNAVPRKSERCVLLGEGCRWYRVILDEAQGIKNRITKASIAAWHLDAHYRLCMTGTPMMNNVEELFSLIRFLRINPYNVWKKFNEDFARPLKAGRKANKDNAMRRLQVVIKAILLRRTKDSRINDAPLLNLPPKIIEVDHVVFDEDQRKFYQSLETRTQLEFNRYLANGSVGRNYSNVLVLLLRLRQCCDHPHLIKDHSVDVQISPDEQEAIAEQFSDEAVNMIREANGAFECPICYDASENPTIFFPCGHDVCGECFARLTDPSQAALQGQDTMSVKCPECRKDIDVKKIISYTIFKKIRLPELCEDHHAVKEEEDKEAEDEDDSGSETASEDDDDDEADDQGNLDGFIVPDGAMEEEEEDGSDDDDDDDLDAPMAKKSFKKEECDDEMAEPKVKDEIKDEDTDDLDFDESAAKRSKAIKKGKRPAVAKSKGKGRGKGKASKKDRKKEKGSKKKKTLADLKRDSQRSAGAKRKYLRRLRKTWVTSAKIEKTLEILATIRARDPEEKTIIFSQFTTFLDLLEVPLDDQQWVTARYDGSMLVKDREAAVDRFHSDKECTVMLISLKAGNAGLNLNWASQVIMLDPFWNPFVEDQAVDRAHRIGQEKAVTVHRLLVPETVEDRILLLQTQKRELISAALDETASKGIARLGVRQLAYLFGVGAQGAGPPTSG